MSESGTARSYFDHNASAPMLPEVRAGVERALELAGNPSSVHAEGRRAHAMIEAARRDVAALTGAEPDRVIFTSGGSEANMTALTPANCGRSELRADTGDCLISSIEHPSVLEGGRFEQAQVRQIGVDANGVIDRDALAREVSKSASRDTPPPLVSVMAANNETGVLQPIGEIAEIVHQAGGVLHSDMVQAAGRVPLEMDRLGIDMASLSAHKIGGPQGCGALVLGTRMKGLGQVLISGGGQERRRRAGTENVPGIVGFGIAAKRAQENLRDAGKVAVLRDFLEQEIRGIAPGTVVFGENADRLPNTICFAVDGMSAETLVIAFDLAGIAVSAGAACSSGKVERSHVLGAMGVPEGLARAAVRVSLGDGNDRADADRFLRAWRDIYGQFEARQKAA